MGLFRLSQSQRARYSGFAARVLTIVGLAALPIVQNAAPAFAADYPCTAAGLTSAITAGGAATFSCAVPTTITAPTTYTIATNADLDGGGLLTIQPSAANQRLFVVPAGKSLKLRNMTVQNFTFTTGPGAAVNVASGGSFESAGVTYLKNVVNGGQSGGALYSSGAVTITGGLFDGNTAADAGGAIGTGTTGTLLISDATFNNNQSSAGGAINTKVGGKISTSVFFSNTATSGAPAAGVEGFAFGGAINVTGTLTILTSTFSSNRATASGGFPGGAATAYGGAIHFPLSASGAITISNSSFYSNTATANGAIGMTPGSANAKGGGVYAGDFGSPLTIYGSTFAYNIVNAAGANGQPAGSSAAPGNGAGGGIFSYAGKTNITNSTIYSNSVTAITNGSTTLSYGNAAGGGVSIEGAATGNFNSVTVLDNQMRFNGTTGSGDGAGINVAPFSGFVNLTNTVVARNTHSSGGASTTENCTSPNPQPTSQKSFGYNLSDDATCLLTATGDLQNSPTATLNFGPLADNGGPTKTIEPLAGSPALDTGNTTCLAVDQRGASRPQGAKCDKGAMEVGNLPQPYKMYVPMVAPNTPTNW